MVSWKRFCFPDGVAIRAEDGAGRTDGTAKSVQQSGRSLAENPYGSDEFGPNPSGSGLAVPPVRPAPKSSTLTQIPSGGTFPSNHERL